MKTCNKCKKEKELSSFRKVGKNKDGLSGVCKTCQYGYEPHNKHCTEKVCTKCKELKDINDFNYSSADHLFRKAQCRKCTNKQANNTRRANHFYKRRDLKEKYGITIELFNQMKIEQNNNCKICNKEVAKLNVDHCHDTNKVRGLLCDNCNWGLGHFKDNSSLMLKAIKYLQETNTDKIV
jgi:hypothetical protein